MLETLHLSEVAMNSMEPIKIGKRFILVLVTSFLLMSDLRSDTSIDLRRERVMQELAPQREKALSGSAAHAEQIIARLASEFKNGDLDQKQFNFWIRIAAENGSASAQHAYAQRLWTLGTSMSNNRKRAIYWATKSKNAGFSPANRLLDMWRHKYSSEFSQ
jgi:TPR repeat protein